jgi:hypothetical protein
VLRLSGGWNSPLLESKPALVKHVLGGWQINTVTTLRAGVVANMVGGGGTTGVGIKLIGDPVLENPTKARWFNTCTLTVAGARQNCASETETAAFQLLPTNSLRLEGNRLEGVFTDEPFYMDLSIFKNFPLPRRVNMQVRAELFNATNVVQWGAPNTNATSPQFGTVGDSQANDPRNIMLSVRVSF